MRDDSIIQVPGTVLGKAISRDEEELREFLDDKAEETKRAYTRAWRAFKVWCVEQHREFFPASEETIVRFLQAWTRDPARSLAQVNQAVSAIGYAHRLAGIDPPPITSSLVKMAWHAARKAKGRRPKNAKAAAAADELRKMVEQIHREALHSSLFSARDAALILIGWWGAFRRSELVGIEVEHIREAPGGISILIPRSKTDQEGEGHVVGIAEVGGVLCPVAALRTWFKASGITSGPVFLGFRRVDPDMLRDTAITADEVAIRVKEYAALAGLDPKIFAGHSLRAGFVTECYRQEVPEAQIIGTTRHKSVQGLLPYRRESNPVQRGASARIKI